MTDEFESNLSEQLGLLADYVNLYDDKKFGHAKSIASRLSVITEMLESRRGAQFVANDKHLLRSNWSAFLPHHKTHGYHPLVSLAVSTTIGSSKTEAEFYPHLDNLPDHSGVELISLSKWQKQIVLMSANGRKLTRRNLYYMMRNSDGGSHAPSAKAPEYAAMADPFGLGLSAFGVEGRVKFNPPSHFATIRHMAHEILNSPRLASLFD